MAKKSKHKAVGSCVDCQSFFEESDGPYRGRCLETGTQISHVEAFVQHDCFKLAAWWVSEDDADEISY